MEQIDNLKKQAEETKNKEEAIEKADMELTEEELNNVTGGYDFQVHHYRYNDGPTGDKSEQKPTVFQPVR